MITIPKRTLLKIFMLYYGAPCKYKTGDGWKVGTIGADMIKHIERQECVMILKPYYLLSADHVKMIHKITKGEDSGAVIEEEPDLSPEGVKEFRNNLHDNIDMAPFQVIDYLRREIFITPVYGFELFRSGFAVRYMENKEKSDTKTGSDGHVNK